MFRARKDIEVRSKEFPTGIRVRLKELSDGFTGWQKDEEQGEKKHW
jgi:hypothetical protein